MSSVTEMRRSLSTVNLHSCPSAGRLGEGNTPFPNPFGQPIGERRSTSPSTITKANPLATIPETTEEQHTSGPSNGFPLQRMNCIKNKEYDDDSKWVTICLRCPSEGLCFACGSQNSNPPNQMIFRSESVCMCDDPNHRKGHGRKNTFQSF